ncbi:ATP-dependent RNA helicase TDRD9-like [Tachypleus tridentatus]|uniref:ATP-dependent RNA helicase TDRD9-like n=1 Tax=Tachypleus tridentatus TaxID=6853 RepID=UPI003FD3581F
MFLLKIVIAGAFYPNYFVRESNDEKEIIKTLSDKDPLCTVVIRLPGLSPMEGSLYTYSIREMFRPCSNKQIRIDFEEGKALVQFSRGQQMENSVYEPMGILIAVYLAVKMRQLRIPLMLKLFSQREARQRMEQLQLLRNQQCEKRKILRSNRITLVCTQQALKQIPLPSTETVTIRLFIPTVLDCGHFWAIYADDINRSNLAYIEETINMYGGKNLQVLKSPPEPGMLVLAPYVDGRGTWFYRARIEDVMSEGVYVFFVDYGNTACIKNLSDIYEIDPENTPDLLTAPAQAFECVLSEVRPSALRSPRGQWTREARDWFKTQVDGQNLVARVYSVVQNVVRLELVKVLPNGQEMSINKKLIDYQFGEAAEESYLSKQNHELSINLQMFSTYNMLPLSSDVEEGGFVHVPFKQEFEEKPSSSTTKVLRLQGPYSPLEISYRGISCLGISRTVHMDRDSVNSVALDPEPQDQHERMLVASHVGLNSTGSAIVVRNTTLMPNVHGLSSIIALLFAPYAELRTDKERTCYTGALCGLGYDPGTKQSIYPDHDMELVFDTTFDCEDISAINKVRMGVNLLLGSEEELAQWAPLQIRNIQQRVKRHLQELISRNRTSREPQEFKRSHRWQQVPEEYQLCSCLEGTEADSYHVLPLHKAVSLCEDTYVEKMREHLIDLQTKASRSLQREVTRCNLCDVILYCPQELLLHLESEYHFEREGELFA